MNQCPEVTKTSKLWNTYPKQTKFLERYHGQGLILYNYVALAVTGNVRTERVSPAQKRANSRQIDQAVC
jgi:hypothetical protein